MANPAIQHICTVLPEQVIVARFSVQMIAQARSGLHILVVAAEPHATRWHAVHCGTEGMDLYGRDLQGVVARQILHLERQRTVHLIGLIVLAAPDFCLEVGGAISEIIGTKALASERWLICVEGLLALQYEGIELNQGIAIGSSDLGPLDKLAHGDPYQGFEHALWPGACSAFDCKDPRVNRAAPIEGARHIRFARIADDPRGNRRQRCVVLVESLV